jgi:hypothetical protein
MVSGVPCPAIESAAIGSCVLKITWSARHVAVFPFVEKLKTTTSVPARQGWDRLRGIGSTAAVKWGLQASAPDTAAVLATNQADSFPAMNPKRSRSRPCPYVEFHIGAACCHQVEILGDRSSLKQA